jgi:hypothetical protein
MNIILCYIRTDDSLSALQLSKTVHKLLLQELEYLKDKFSSIGWNSLKSNRWGNL